MSLWGGGTPAGTQPAVSGAKLTYNALRELGVLRVGYRPSPEWLDDGLDRLNKIIDAWNTEELTVPATTRTVYSLTADKQEYSLGPNGDLDSARPPRIEAAGIVPLVGDEYPVEILSDNAWPLMTIRLQTAPVGGESLAIYSQGQLELFGDLDTEYLFPQGYALALELTLAVHLAPRAILHMKTAVPAMLLADIQERQREAVARIKRKNLTMGELVCDSALVPRPGFDILRGRQ